MQSSNQKNNKYTEAEPRKHYVYKKQSVFQVHKLQKLTEAKTFTFSEILLGLGLCLNRKCTHMPVLESCV